MEPITKKINELLAHAQLLIHLLLLFYLSEQDTTDALWSQPLGTSMGETHKLGDTLLFRPSIRQPNELSEGLGSSLQPFQSFISFISKMRITKSNWLIADCCEVWLYGEALSQILALNSLHIQSGCNPVCLGWPARPIWSGPINLSGHTTHSAPATWVFLFFSNNPKLFPP